MPIKDDISAEIDGILNAAWDIRDGTVVPKTADVMLAGGGVRLSATMLYADLADSTSLATSFDRRIAAEVIKVFLSTCSRIIRANNGHIRSFDGDRVMGVFLNDYKNTTAAKTALKINWAVQNLVKPRIEAQYPVLHQGGYSLAHCVGIDVSDVLVIRGGIRNNNDLIWIGRSPNVAAKLATLRESPYNSFITKDVFDRLADEGKFGGDSKTLMWEERSWNPAPDVTTVYRSHWRWKLD